MTHLNICRQAVQLALKKGASDVKVVASTSESYGDSVFQGESGGFEGESNIDFSVKVYVGQKVGQVSTTDLSEDAVADAVDAAITVAKGAEENPYEGLVDASEIGTVSKSDITQLNLVDPNAGFTPQEMVDMATEMEKAAFAVPTVDKSRSADVQYDIGTHAVVMSNGFEAEESYTRHQAVMQAVAEKDGKMMIDYDYHYGPFKNGLDSMAVIGKKAAENAASKLNQVELEKSGKIPVVLKPEITASLLRGHLSSAVNGAAIFAKSSFLNKDMIGQKLFGSNVTLFDDRLLPGSFGSSVFTLDGLVGPQSVAFVENGVLQHLTTDVITARKLALPYNQGRPRMYNAQFKVDDVSVKDLIADIKYGFYVTGLMGKGYTATTGDISYTVEGFIIRDGLLTGDFVLKATLAGNLQDMLNNVTFANDLETRNNLNASTSRLEGVTIG